MGGDLQINQSKTKTLITFFYIKPILTKSLTANFKSIELKLWRQSYSKKYTNFLNGAHFTEDI